MRTFNVVKMSIVSKLTFQFNEITVKIPAGFPPPPPQKWQADAKTHVEIQWTRIGKKKSWKRKKGKTHTFQFHNYYKATVIKLVWNWYKDRQVDQWNRIKRPEINSYIYDDLIFDKDAHKTQWEKIGFSTNGVGTIE